MEYGFNFETDVQGRMILVLGFSAGLPSEVAIESARSFFLARCKQAQQSTRVLQRGSPQKKTIHMAKISRVPMDQLISMGSFSICCFVHWS